MMDDWMGRRTLLKACGLEAGRVLDVGMGGCGCMSVFLAKRGFDVVGIDHSTKAVHEARSAAHGKKWKGSFEAFLGDARRLKFKDGAFDVVLSYHSLHHIDGVEKAISEMFRVCKPGGCVLIADLHEDGRKAYEHAPDGERLLKKLEKLLIKHAKEITTMRTKYNTMFICRR